MFSRSKKSTSLPTATATRPVEPEPSTLSVEPQLTETVTETEHIRKKRKAIKRGADLASAIPTAVFRRLVREIARDFKSDLRWEAEALEALQVDAEAYLVGQFGEANKKRDMCDSRTLKKAHFVIA